MKLEDLPAGPTRPTLVQTAAKDVRGLDLLGLRSPAEGVAVRLLDGVTTVTPNIRYFSLRSWIILRYLDLGGLNDRKAFRAFAAKVEAAVAYGSALSGDDTNGVVGRDLATAKIEDSDGELKLAPLTKILAVSVYGGPSQNLGVGDVEGEVPGLTNERGLPLAKEFERLVKDDDVLTAVNTSHPEQTFSRERLTEMGRRLSMAKPTAQERSRLLSCILPTNPRAQELPRIASYSLLLHACKTLNARVDEAQVFDLASSHDLSGVPAELHKTCDGWTRFLGRDLLVLLHEAAVSLVLDRLAQSSHPGKRAVLHETIDSLVPDDLDLCLNGLGLVGVRAEDPIRTLHRAVIDRMGGCFEQRNLRRWVGPLRESDLFAKTDLTRSPMGLAMLPVGWIVACQRIEPGVVAQEPGFDLDGLAGTSRLGVGSVLLPEVRQWASSDESVRHVIGRLVRRSVDQHLRIAWSRLAREPHKDVSLLQSDGDEWIFLKHFRPGRATSRLYQALNWLRQLELVSNEGLTPLGSGVLDEGLTTLRRWDRRSS